MKKTESRENQTTRRRSMHHQHTKVTEQQTRLLDNILELNKNFVSHTDLTSGLKPSITDVSRETKPNKPPRRMSLGSSLPSIPTKASSEDREPHGILRTPRKK